MPAVSTNNFDLACMIGMFLNAVQFDKQVDEDPNEHLSHFLQMCVAFKLNGVIDDAIRLRLFPFSLKGATYR